MFGGMLNPFDPDAFVIRLDAHLVGIKPRITRSLELPVDLNFAQLHEVLQAAFGWTDSHLHHFIAGGLTIGAPEFDEDALLDVRTCEASEIRLQDLTFPREEDSTLRILYEYDFGDDWQHDLILRRIPPTSPAPNRIIIGCGKPCAIPGNGRLGCFICWRPWRGRRKLPWPWWKAYAARWPA